MLTNDHRIFYVDPVQDPIAHADRILVTDTITYHRRTEYVNTIRAVRKARHNSRSRLWHITAEEPAGVYVTGAPLNPPLDGGGHVLALLADGRFAVGEAGYTTSTAGTTTLRAPRRSDQQVFTALTGDDYQGALRTGEWVKAAPWAYELMPEPDDDYATVQAKAVLAKTLWIQRRTKFILTAEGVERDWTAELDELASDGHDLPERRYGLWLTGDVLVNIDTPDNVLQNPHVKSVRETISENTGDASPALMGARVLIRTSFPSEVSLDDEQLDANQVSPDSHVRAARQATGLTGTTMTNVSTSPFLRTTI